MRFPKSLLRDLSTVPDRSSVLSLTSSLFITNEKGAKQQLKTAVKMSREGSPELGIYPEFVENGKEISLFDPDSKDSGYSEDNPEESEITVTGSLLSLDNEATIMCFSPEGICAKGTPKNLFSGGRKRLFVSPGDSPSVVAAHSLKKLKIFDLECDEGETFEELPIDFSDEVLAQLSDDETQDGNQFEHDFSRNKQSDAWSVEEQNSLVKDAVERSEGKDLIGNFSKGYALPLIRGSHPDLKSISVETMRDLLNGKYEHILHSMMIIDSRYPYEFQGGHIQGAINIYSKEDCLDLLNTVEKPADERHILIFHCEFSKERGPNMVRSLRQEDRTRNTRSYPALTYPEVYVLEGGYKKFYEKFPEHCDPMAYKQMVHPEHADEMRFFRKKSRTSDNVLKTSRKKQLPVVRSSLPVRKFLSNDF